MKRVVAGLAGVYLLAALIGRVTEAMGIHTCGCAEDCWCRKPGLSVFRWVFPRGHHVYGREDTRPFVT
jgi:hypothetical protein